MSGYFHQRGLQTFANFDVYLHAKMISIPNFFFEILQRYCKLVWVIWKHLIMPINNDKCWNKLFGNSAWKKSTSALSSFLRYCKDIANLLSWELWEFLTIYILSIFSKPSCLPACKRSTSSLNSFFIYYNEIQICYSG